MKTAVVILNWNGKHFLEKFLPNVINFTQSDDAEIIVADNGSSDGSVDWLRINYPSLKLICFDQNYGFTGGYNRALQQIDTEYFVLLNSDIEVTPGWLNPLISFLDANPKCAAVMPKILDFQKRNYFEHAGACGGFIDYLGYPFCRGRILSKIEQDNGQYDQNAKIFWASGACLCIRSKLFFEAGMLDNLFFAHMEEIDLCWRLYNLGYEIYAIPASVIYHVGGGALPNNNPRKLFLNYRNNLLMLYKNLPRKQKLKIFPVRFIFDVSSSFIYLAKGHVSFFTSVYKAYWHFFKMKPKYKKHLPEIIYGFSENAPVFKKSILISGIIWRRTKFSELNINSY